MNFLTVSVTLYLSTESVVISFGQLSLTVEENAGQFTMCVVKSTSTQFSVSADISITDISTTPILGEFYPVIQFSLTAQQCTICSTHRL